MTTLYILLDATAAAAVRGMSSAGHSLEPVLLADGVSFALPAAVLADPAHAARHALLASAPQREVGDADWRHSDEMA
ncbi:MAG: hypothetical protein B7Z15_07300 [Rhizobiales bacterium 32-66-8]|nr:MAG: hypothetical protein B7Z15_07300 [Rhizobiales bacterium 32-66-8]